MNISKKNLIMCCILDKICHFCSHKSCNDYILFFLKVLAFLSMSLRVYHKNLQELSYLSTIQFDCMKVALFKYENNKVHVQLWISEYCIYTS